LPRLKFFIIAVGLVSGLFLSYPIPASGQEQNIYREGGEDRVFYDPDDPEYYNNLTKFRYILYYGGFTDEIASAILTTEPTMLVTNYYALSPAMRSEFAKNNV
jgi:hypothetical protein